MKDRTTISNPRDPEYYPEARDAIMNVCPFYSPYHKGGIVSERVFHDCLKELRERSVVLSERLAAKQATMETLKEQLKADEAAAYDLRKILHDVADHCGVSTSLWPTAIADRLKQMKDDKDEIETMWEALCQALGAHGPESDPLTGTDSNEDIQKRALELARTLKEQLSAARHALTICDGAMTGKVKPTSPAFALVRAILYPDAGKGGHDAP